MFSFVGNIIGGNGAKFLADFFAVIFGSVGHVFKNTILNIFYTLFNILASWIWTICKWVLGAIDMFQFTFTRFLGLDLGDETMLSLGDYVEGMKEITISGGSNYYDYIMKIFRALFGVALVLMIVFTIVAIIMQEYNLAVNGYQKADNSKGRFFKVILTNILSIFLVPLVFYTIIIGTNSILTSFYRALGGYSDTTVAGNVLAAATYDANRYRAYANANKRIPITISVYEMDNGFGKAKGDEELKKEIQRDDVQEKLRAIAGSFVDNNFLPFEKSTAYNNGSWSNYKNYSIEYNNTMYDDMGMYFENFICTREQYYVLADFVDYCQLYNIKYYIKAISEDDICWKYVDDIALGVEKDEEGNAISDLTLDVVYRDAEVVNNPSGIEDSASAAPVAGSNGSGFKKLQLTTKLDLTSPISDALKTASTLLGLDQKDSSFNVMERDETGDFVNLVEWANRKVKLKFSTVYNGSGVYVSGFKLDDPTTWTFSDQIIVYEYFRFQNDFSSTNNTLEDYTIEQIQREGIYLDAQVMTFRNYNSNTETYADEQTQYCVKINNSYYRIKESNSEFDDYGQPYFVLTAKDENLDYFENQRISIEKTGTKTLKLSTAPTPFNINNRSTWSFTDQVLVYEYFKDLSLSNGLRRTNKFTDFVAGVDFYKYKITKYDDSNGSTLTSKNYLYINGTYYECNASGDLISGGASSFLMDTSAAGNRYFGYKLSGLADKSYYGLDVLDSYSSSFIKSSIGTETPVGDNNAMYQKYSKMNMKLSSDFSFYNTDTWTFRDYVIMYIYVNTLSVDKTITIESLKLEGIEGEIVVTGDDYYLKVQYKNAINTILTRYIDLESFNEISEQKITSTIATSQFEDLSLGSTNLNFVHQFSSTEDVLLNKVVSSKFFNMSENFDAYDPTTWAIGDYLLLYLIEKGYIDTSIELLKIKGYSSLCYETSSDGNFYRFGTKDKAYYLSEKKISAIGYTVEKWFNTNLMSFLLSTRYGNLGTNDILIGEKDFADGTATNADAYLYDITTDFSDTFSLQYILAQDFLKSDNIITDILKIQYTYSNPTVNVNDLATWSYLDTIIYVLTGNVPTRDNPFESYLYLDSTDDIYLKISDYYVQINDSSLQTKCLLSGSTVLTNQIYSDNRKTFENETKFNEYYDARLKGMMVKGSALTGVESLTNFYYYSKDLPRTGTISTTPLGKLMSDFDFILAKHSKPLESDGIYTFSAVSTDDGVFVKIKDGATDAEDDWMRITSNDSALIHYKENSIIPYGPDAFTLEGTHTAFQKTSGVYNYTQYDAILYAVFGSASEDEEFNKYKCNIDGKHYLDVNGKFVEYQDLDDLLNISTTVVSDEKLAYLYSNYYHQFVSTSVPSTKAQYNLYSIPTTTHGVSVSTSEKKVEQYDGFNAICETLNIPSINSCLLIESSDGTYYLKYNSYYINLTNLIDVTIETGISTSVNLILDENSKEVFRWKYRLIEDTTPIVFRAINYLKEADMESTGWSTHAQEFDIVVSDSVARNTIKTITSTSEWTWLGLISAFVDPTDTFNVRKYYHAGKVYYYFKNSNADYLVPYSHTWDAGAFTLDSKISAASGAFSYITSSHTIGTDTRLDVTMRTLGVVSTETPNTNVTKFESKKSSILQDFYLVKKVVGLTTTYHVIYGLSDVTATAGSVVKYLEYVSGSFEEKTETNYVFSFTSRPISELTSWTMLDFIAYYATESIYASTIVSKVCVYNSRYYIQHNDKFMLIPKLSGASISDLFVHDSGIGKIINVSSATNKFELDQMITYNNYANVATEDLPAAGTQCVYDYASASMDATLKGLLDDFATSVSTSTTDKPFQNINFAGNFDLSNYKSWTYSDYVIYYAFTNGFYGTTATTKNYVLPFVYIPKFAVNGSTYYNLTYLDIVLAKICGESGDPSWYNYFTSTEAAYNFKLIYTSSATAEKNNLFYLEYDGHYVPLSGEIGIDFSKMEVVSSQLEENFSASDLRTKVEEFTDTATDYYLGTSLGSGVSAIEYKTTFDNKNFQTFVNANCAPAYIYYLLDQDDDTGSVTATKVINFAFEGDHAKDGVYFSYDKFYEFYDDYLVNHLNTETAYQLSVTISTSDLSAVAPSPYDMVAKLVYDQIYPDIVFDNYYYYVLDAEKANALSINTVDVQIQKRIKSGDLSGTSIKQKQINLRLSSAFLSGGNAQMAASSNWTVLDYIILYERSREKVRHNVFQNMSISELAKTDYLYTVYCLDFDSDGNITEADDIYLYVNNNFYNLRNCVSLDGEIFVGDEYFASGTNPISSGNINAYDFKVLFTSYDLSINPDYKGSEQYNRDKDNISFSVEGSPKIHFKYIDKNYADTNFRINVSLYGKYSVKALIKKTSWVEKLMTDMQVYYPNISNENNSYPGLNWGVLIATDGWLDTLGEFTSANINGLFTGGQNSSNTTAAGLVLAEFFMSVANEVDGGYAEYEYSSVFDKDTIRALMMSLMGEEVYQALVFEAEVFMDYFNSCFAPIIDDFAEEFGEDINNNSLRLNAYKSYLATLLLSSDIGEYLYTIATRVYAEYTIGEYLASAAGDYVGYYSYVNKLKDENGQTVDAFSYGTILELIRYENQYCGNSNPIFTFNFKKAFIKYRNRDDDTGTVAGYTLAEALGDTDKYDRVSERLLQLIDADYDKLYGQGYDVNDAGKVVNSAGEEVVEELENTYIYCYMLHVYWEIRSELTLFTQPSYLKCYRQYLDGKLTRWDIVKTENIQTADQYFEDYESENIKLGLYKATTLLNTARLFIPGLTFNNKPEGILGVLKELWGLIKDGFGAFVDPSRLADNITVPIFNANSIVKHDSELKKDIVFIGNNTVTLYFTMCFSEDSLFEIADLFEEALDYILPIDLSPKACWERILQYYDSMENIINELKLVRELLPGETTDRGSSREILDTGKYYTDMQLDFMINAFVDIRSNLDKYISTQKRIDQAQKRSITFTLAQYGANYVSGGYEFSVRNKAYTFKPETDPVRLAEYVYGGAFLESVGEGAKYTDPEFTGIVKASKVYDNKDNVLKTNLDTWSELRGFLTKIADQTAELYFTTNLADLDISKNNEVKISDPVKTTYGVTTYNSIEEALYHYMRSGIAQEIGGRITDCYNDDGSIDTTLYETYSHERFAALVQYVLSGRVNEEDLENITLEDLKRAAMKQVMANEQNQSESPEERADKYMLVFNMLGVQVDFNSNSATTKPINRVIYKSQIDRDESGGVVTKLNYIENGADRGELKGKLRVSGNTLETIKVLSGLENRPDREILTRQYAGIRPGDYYDEAFGDTFVACTYKDGLYYPILGTASKNLASHNSLYEEYLNKGFIKHKFTSKYYDNDANVVVVKGVITADGYPTAVRKYNNPIEVMQKGLFSSKAKTFNSVTYYRTNVGTNFGEGEDLVDASRVVGRITTKNYTKYVQGTAFTKGIGDTVTYTGRTNLKTVVSSDYNANFVQSRAEYLMGQADDLGGVSVLDDFSFFYLFGGQSWILLMLAFITIFPVMVNACGGAGARILDILVLYLASPIVISTNSLYPDGKNSIYKKWKKNVMGVLMGTFGYIVAFTSFTLLVPMVYNIDSFISVDTYNKIVGIGGIGNLISYPLVNGLLRFLWIITAASILDKLPEILLPIITANRGDLVSPHPGLGSGAGKKFTDKAQSVVKSAKEVGTILSGKAALGAVKSLKDDALNMIPGYGAAKLLKEKVIDPMNDKRHKQLVAAEEKIIEEGLKAYGVDPKIAKAAAKAAGAAHDAKKKAKDDNKKRMEQYKKEFQSLK